MLFFFFLKGVFYLEKSVSERQQRNPQRMATHSPLILKKKKMFFVYTTYSAEELDIFFAFNHKMLGLLLFTACQFDLPPFFFFTKNIYYSIPPTFFKKENSNFLKN